ncbi:hypothetical protein [Xenorhabdus siamensis]|uniref:hypothetical protein n=1 Tax=Xenorhabdus siamensis TaxID=3136254 RepID=UPI0030F48B87
MVKNTTYNAVESRFGESGVIELTALDGYFSLLGQELNVARSRDVTVTVVYLGISNGYTLSAIILCIV